jgi:predicted ATPase
MRIALCGASGTGKTTIANHVAQKYGLPINPIGSRSVAKAMGFESPYDVDKAGKRAEFQRCLLEEKRAWENDHEAFVTDRTTLDNLAYTVLHAVHTIDEEEMTKSVAGFYRYTHVIYCPTQTFCKPGNDPARVKNMVYHELFDILVKALVAPHTHGVWMLEISSSELPVRLQQVESFLRCAQ